MPILTIRHGLSEANNRDNVGTLACAAKDAPLMDKGKEQARERAARLPGDHGVDPRTTSVAVSHLLRTRQTAEVMGFRLEFITPYESLKQGQEPKIMEPDKCDEIGWFSLDGLPQPLSLITRTDLIEYGKRNVAQNGLGAA